MYNCDYCGKEFKSKSGLVRHQKTCVKPEEVITEAGDSVEAKVIENSSKSNLDKVKSAYRSTYDAEARMLLELEYKSLGGNPSELRS